MALTASLCKIRRVHRRPRIVRTKNVVNAVAGSAIRSGQRAFALSQAVKALGVGGNTVGGKVVPPWQSVQSGASWTPALMAWPCTLSRNVLAISLWHVPQVSATFQ